MPAIVQKTVFISYRRSVAPYIARSIFLSLHSSGYDVFMDIESIGPGEFESIILNQIEARAHFLAILTPGTLDRCCEPGDWLRREIEHALKMKRNVIPVLVNNFRFEDTKELLTGDLEKLQGYQGLPLFHEYFDAGMERLCDRFLTRQVNVYVEPTPDKQVPEVRRKIEEAAEEPPPTEAQLSAEDYFFMGWIRDNLGLPEDAVTDYTEAIRLNPQLAEAYYNRGIVRENQDDLEGAIADYKKYLELGGGERNGDREEIERLIEELRGQIG